jgi:hypothetical protein
MIRPIRARLAALLSLLAPLSLAACAAAPPPAPPPEPPPPPPGAFAGQLREVSPVDQEMLAIAHAEEEIDRIFPGAGAAHRKGGPPPPPPPPLAGATNDDKAKTAADKPGPEKPADALASREEAGGGCAVACRALSSMLSAADRLCKLAGENDGRCDDARARVHGAMARVKTACPGCSVSAAPEAPRAPPRPAPPAGPAPGMPGSSSTPIP